MTLNIHQARAVHVWTAQPEDVQDGQWPELAFWLDAAELHCALRFGHQADRRAYVLAHALRRLAVSGVLGVPPAELVFSNPAGSQPVLLNAPETPEIHFSHSRSRKLVACAVSCIGPVGIDVEVVDAGKADMRLLRRFLALPGGPCGQDNLAGDPARQFFFYWTVLEAYWKSRGCGLSFANPALSCPEHRAGWFDLSLLAGDAWLACGRALVLQSPVDCAAALALDASCFESAPEGVEVICHQPVFFQAGGPVLQPPATMARARQRPDPATR